MGRYLCAVRSHGINLTRHMASQAIASRLQGKVALVTGSTKGIGYAIARRLAQEGAKVVVNSRKEADIQRTVHTLQGEGHTVHGVKGHVAKSEDRKLLVQETIDKYGRLDILVPNVATNPLVGPILTVTTEEAWDKIFETNVKSTFFLVKEAFPYLSKQGGSITFVSSIAGSIVVENIGAYSVSKSAINGLTRALVAQCTPNNIRVNCIAPGMIKTDFSRVLLELPEGKASLHNIIPMHRIGTSEECAGAVAFLASDDASYMTGQILSMDGGVGTYVSLGPNPDAV